VRDDILFQELRELRNAQTALSRSIESLLQQVSQVLDLLRTFVESQCHCQMPAPPTAAPPDEQTVYTPKQVAEILQPRHVQTITKWCLAIEVAEKAQKERLKAQQLDEMKRRNVPAEQRDRLLKLPPRTVRQINGNDAGPWVITPTGLAKLREMHITHPQPTPKATKRQREEVFS
jgi:hypothetical protein